ncbi:MAG: hypothetical protein AAFV53_03275 [Myxococcota bacterium]
MIDRSLSPLAVLGLAALLTGCGVEFGVEDDGDFTVTLGEFNDTCFLEPTEYPIEEGGACVVEHRPSAGDASLCEVTTVCSGLSLIDPIEINEEIQETTGDSPTRAEIIALSITLTELSFSAGSPRLAGFDMVTDSVKTDRYTVFEVDLQQAGDLLEGQPQRVVDAQPGDRFLDQLNESIVDATALPMEVNAVIKIPLSDVQTYFVGEDVTTSLSYDINSTGSGRLCFFGCD